MPSAGAMLAPAPFSPIVLGAASLGTQLLRALLVLTHSHVTR